ncbi:MAG: biopolymer transporter ExbD [Pseudomonadota bacterium]
MARRSRKVAADTNAEDDVNLTPMLDVVFILLIFFIVTAVFIKMPGAEINRQQVDNLEATKPLAILIAVDENSDIWIANENVDIEEVGFKIKEMREENSLGELVLQIDESAEAGKMIDLLEIVAQEDGTQISRISTNPRS